MSNRVVQCILWLIALLTLAGATLAEAGPRLVWVDPRDGADFGLSSLDADQIRALGVDGFLFPALSEGRVHHSSNLLPTNPAHSALAERFHRLKSEGFSVGLYFQVFVHGGRIDSQHHLARLKPEWLSYSRTSEPLRRFLDGPTREKPFLDGLFFDPGVPKFTEFYIALLTEALVSMSPDWIVLDQVGYPLVEPAFEGVAVGEQPYGYHPVARGNFKATQGVDPLNLTPTSQDALFGARPDQAQVTEQAWNDARRESVNVFVRSARELLASYPRTRLAVVGHPDPILAKGVLFQDWPRWLREGWVDSIALPAHDSQYSALPDLSLLDPTLREKIWLAGTLPADSRPADYLAGLGEGIGDHGWILFEERPAGFSSEPSPSISSDSIHENLERTGWTVADSSSIPSGVRTEAEPNSVTTKTYTAETKALYGFDPGKPPFDRLGPEGVVEKLLDLGFNAVFGGSESPELRTALRAAGVRRFGEYPVFVGRTYWDQDPSTRPVGPDGKPIARQSWYAPLDPHLPWLRDVKRKALLDRVREQELDGVWLDFIRFPVFWEEVPPKLIETSFSAAALTAFQEKTGLVPEGETASEMADWILRNADEEWRRFRSETILDFVRGVEEGLREISPDILLGAFVLPWTPEEHGGALHRIAGQDLQGFARIVDILSPMVYFHQLGRPPEWVHERTAQIASEVGIPLHPIVQCFDEPTPAADSEVEEAIRNGRLAPSQGVILFSQRHLESTGRWELVRRVLREDAPPAPSAAPLSSP